MLADAARAQVDQVAQHLADPLLRHLAGAVQVDIDRQRLGHADGVGQLQGAFVGHAAGHHILGQIAAGIGGGAVHLGRVLAGEGAAAVRGGPAVGVDDDLAAGQPGVAVRPADDELAGGIDVELVVRAHPAVGQHPLDMLAHQVAQRVGVHVGLVLGGHHHRAGADRPAVHIAQGHLALGIGLQQVGRAVAPGGGQRLQNLVGVIERGGHQRVGLAAGVAEHDALVAGTLVLVALGVHALGDIRRLGVQVAFEFGIAPVKAGLLVADVAHRVADGLFQHVRGDRLRPANLAGQDDAIGGHQRLGGHPRHRVGGQERVQHGIGNPVRHLVGMAFGNRLAGEEIIALCHRSHSVRHGSRKQIAVGRRQRPALSGNRKRKPRPV